ncbi:MAG: trigger factor [Acutalibacteraceae bacterium]
MVLKSNEKTETNKSELVVSVEKEIFDKAINKVYKKQVKNIQVPGFRKGKAPRNIVEKMYGEGVFYEDAMQECYPEALDEAIKEAELNVVAVDKLECDDVSKDGFTFKATVVTYPVVDIKDYKGIEVTKKSTEVTEELIDEEIDKIRDRNSRMVTVDDRPAEKGDTVVIDFEGFLDGEPFDGGKAENHNLLLGSNQFIPGFEDQIEGHSTGDEFSINVTFPEDYQAEDLKGKETEFKIVLHEIKKKELPEVDDEFVKDVSEKDTVEEYREELKGEIATRLEDESKKDLEDQLVNALCEKLEGEIPEQMYDNAVDEMLRDMRGVLQNPRYVVSLAHLTEQTILLSSAETQLLRESDNEAFSEEQISENIKEEADSQMQRTN